MAGSVGLLTAAGATAMDLSLTLNNGQSISSLNQQNMANQAGIPSCTYRWSGDSR